MLCMHLTLSIILALNEIALVFSTVPLSLITIGGQQAMVLHLKCYTLELGYDHLILYTEERLDENELICCCCY